MSQLEFRLVTVDAIHKGSKRVYRVELTEVTNGISRFNNQCSGLIEEIAVGSIKQ
jgi:hypothetical protein